MPGVSKRVTSGGGNTHLSVGGKARKSNTVPGKPDVMDPLTPVNRFQRRAAESWFKTRASELKTTEEGFRAWLEHKKEELGEGWMKWLKDRADKNDWAKMYR